MIRNNIEFLDNIGAIRNKGALVRIIGKKSGTPASQVDTDAINRRAENIENSIFFNAAMKRLASDVDNTAKLRLIDTGYKLPDTQETIYISLTKNNTGIWEGGRAGTLSQLTNEFVSVNPEASIKNDTHAQTEQNTSVPVDNTVEEKKFSAPYEENIEKTTPVYSESTDYTEEVSFIDDNNSIPDTPEESERPYPPAHQEPEPEQEQLQTKQNTSDYDTEPGNIVNDLPDYTENDNENKEESETNEDNELKIEQESSKPEQIYTANNNIIIENAANVNIDNSILVLNKSWVSENNLNSALQYYIDSICTYAYTHQDTQDMITNGKSMYVINTGILDKYGHDIYVEFHVTESNDIVIIDKYQIVESKSTLLEAGFSYNDIKKTLNAITVWQDFDETMQILSAEFEDFDFVDRSILNTLITSKKELFDSMGICITPYGLTRRIEESVQLALQINQRDHGYIRPAYDKSSGKIHFLIPLRIDVTMDDEPELVLEVEHNSGFYKIYDIITPSEAYLKAKVISPYRTLQ